MRRKLRDRKGAYTNLRDRERSENGRKRESEIVEREREKKKEGGGRGKTIAHLMMYYTTITRQSSH